MIPGDTARWLTCPNCGQRGMVLDEVLDEGERYVCAYPACYGQRRVGGTVDRPSLGPAPQRIRTPDDQFARGWRGMP